MTQPSPHGHQHAQSPIYVTELLMDFGTELCTVVRMNFENHLATYLMFCDNPAILYIFRKGELVRGSQKVCESCCFWIVQFYEDAAPLSICIILFVS